MTPSKSELHAGAKRIAERTVNEYGFGLDRSTAAIIALAESHAAAETAALREALERIATRDLYKVPTLAAMYCGHGKIAADALAALDAVEKENGR